MPTPALPRPTVRVTLNLYASDHEFLKRNEAQWSPKVRDLVHAYVQRRKRETHVTSENYLEGDFDA